MEPYQILWLPCSQITNQPYMIYWLNQGEYVLLQIHLVVSTLMFLEMWNQGLTASSHRPPGSIILRTLLLKPSGTPLRGTCQVLPASCLFLGSQWPFFCCYFLGFACLTFLICVLCITVAPFQADVCTGIETHSHQGSDSQRFPYPPVTDKVYAPNKQ